MIEMFELRNPEPRVIARWQSEHFCLSSRNLAIRLYAFESQEAYEAFEAKQVVEPQGDE